MSPSARALALLNSPLGLQLFHLLEWRHESEKDLSDTELFDRANEARSSNTVYRGDYEEHLRFLRSQSGRFVPVAESVARRMAAWWEPLDREAQIWANPNMVPPSPSGLVLDLEQPHPEAPKPKDALWTCTLAPRVVTPWVEWGEHIRHSRSHGLWRLSVTADARVAEIHSPEDWWELVSAYPAKAPGFRYALMPHPSHSGAFTADRSPRHARRDPDWHAIARDFDGAHLSMAGLMTAQDVPLERDGVTTELRGWDVESTVWFRWVFESVEELHVRD